MAYLLGKAAVFGLAFAGVDDGDLLTTGQQKRAGVASLAAAQRVKHGAVEHDALRSDGGDGGLALVEVTVLAEKVLGHGDMIVA